MNILQSLFYGLISGFAEFLPISSQGHQVLLLQLFGLAQRDPILDLLVHLSLLAALFICCRKSLTSFRREIAVSKRHGRRRNYRSSVNRTYDLRLITTAAVPLLAGLLLSNWGKQMEDRPLMVCLFFIINGVVLYIPEHLRQSNKDASAMTGFDAILIGFLGALSILPGISRIGICTSSAISRGADKQHALNWVLILSIPALVMLILFDFVSIFNSVNLAISFLIIIGYLLAAMSAFASACAGIMLMRFLTVRTGFSSFASYCWGAAMLIFILYLIA